MQDTKFAVAWINWFDNDLVIEQVWAKTWREAIFAHSKTQFISLEEIPEDIEEAKRLAFDMDAMFDVMEV